MKKSAPKQHFVFDLDDTLTDAREFCGESMARAITKLEPGKNPALIKIFHDSIRGASVIDLYKQAIKEFGLESPLEKLLEIDQKIQTTEHHRIKIFDGVIDILKHLKSRGKNLHICTNRTTETLYPILRFNKLEDYFDTITSCIDEGYKKPDPTTLKRLIKKYHSNIDEFIYFGDSEVDREFAKNSNIEFIVFDQYLNDKNLFVKLINLFVEENGNGSHGRNNVLKKRLSAIYSKVLHPLKLPANNYEPITKLKANM